MKPPPLRKRSFTEKSMKLGNVDVLCSGSKARNPNLRIVRRSRLFLVESVESPARLRELGNAHSLAIRPFLSNYPPNM